jgi:site-specific DNA recombinase
MKQFKIAFYIRCSTEEQGLHANPEGTIKNQEQRLRYEVEAKNRVSNFGEIVGVFVEDGLSAKDTKRPALQKMLKAIELGEINLVMVTEYSRLSRSMRDFSAMWELFKSYKCSVISLRENFDTSSAAGEMMLYNMANLAQYERRMTSERVIASRIDRSRRGL